MDTSYYKYVRRQKEANKLLLFMNTKGDKHMK